MQCEAAIERAVRKGVVHVEVSLRSRRMRLVVEPGPEEEEP
jgi:hypothetical protein